MNHVQISNTLDFQTIKTADNLIKLQKSIESGEFVSADILAETKIAKATLEKVGELLKIGVIRFNDEGRENDCDKCSVEYIGHITHVHMVLCNLHCKSTPDSKDTSDTGTLNTMNSKVLKHLLSMYGDKRSLRCADCKIDILDLRNNPGDTDSQGLLDNGAYLIFTICHMERI